MSKSAVRGEPRPLVSPLLDLVVDCLDQNDQARDLLGAELVQIVSVRRVKDHPRDFLDARREDAAGARVDAALRGVQVAVMTCDKRLWVSWHVVNRARVIGLTIDV